MFSNKPQQQYQQQGYGYPPPPQQGEFQFFFDSGKSLFTLAGVLIVICVPCLSGYYPPPPQQGYYQGPPPQRRDNSGMMGCLIGLLACCACEECLDICCC